MTLVSMSCRPVRTPRQAFTLIELLVVIAIIGIIMALSVSAILKALGTQQSSNTKTVISKIEAVKTDRWKAAVDDAYKKGANIPSLASSPDPNISSMGSENPNAAADILALANGDGKRAHVIYVSYYLKQQFPTSFAEVLGRTYAPGTPTPQYYNPLGANPAYLKKLTTTYPVKANAVPQLGESAALLLMAMERGTGGQGRPADAFGPSIKNLSFPNVNAANPPVDMPVLKDDWGTPLQFYRWSTADPDLDAVVPPSTSKLRNPLDPDNKLRDANWFNVNGKPNPARVLFEASCYALSDNKGNPYTYYITPVIVSAGPNLKFGIDPQTMAVTNQADANDNIYSYRLKRE